MGLYSNLVVEQPGVVCERLEQQVVRDPLVPARQFDTMVSRHWRHIVHRFQQIQLAAQGTQGQGRFCLSTAHNDGI